MEDIQSLISQEPSWKAWEILCDFIDANWGGSIQDEELMEINGFLQAWPDEIRRCPQQWFGRFLSGDEFGPLSIVRVLQRLQIDKLFKDQSFELFFRSPHLSRIGILDFTVRNLGRAHANKGLLSQHFPTLCNREDLSFHTLLLNELIDDDDLKQLLLSPAVKCCRNIELKRLKERGDLAVNLMVESEFLPKLDKINIDWCGLTEAGLTRLMNAEVTSKLRSLEYTGNEVNSVGVHAIADSLNSSGIRELSLSLNEETDSNLLEILADSSQIDHLTHFRFSRRRKETSQKSMRVLSDSAKLAEKLESLALYDVAPQGIEELSNSRFFRHLKKLTLTSSQPVGQQIVVALAKAPWFSNLISIFLSDFDLNNDSLEQLVKHCGQPEMFAMYGDTSLEPGAYKIIGECENMAQLRHLHLYTVRCCSEDVLPFANSPFLTNIEAMSFRFEGPFQGPFEKMLLSMGHSPSWSKLRSLDLCYAGTHISPDFLQELAETSSWKLDTLDLERKRIGDAGIEALCSTDFLSNIRVLRLRVNQITDRGIRALTNNPHLKNLKALSIEANQVTEAGIELIEKCPHFNLVLFDH